MKRIHVKGNTWVLEGPQLVGLYQIDESTCLLLDPGSTKLQGEIEAALAQAGLTIHQVLADNDAYHALEKVDGLIRTGPTGTNVNDVAVVLLKN